MAPRGRRAGGPGAGLHERCACGDAEVVLSHPAAVLSHLESCGRFSRDSGFGGLFHPGMASFREQVPVNSLHVLIDGERISAHVDRVSPLGMRDRRRARYSLRRAVAHNVAGMAHDLTRLARGRQGDHRCELNCEWVTPGSIAASRTGEADPGAAGASDEDRLDLEVSSSSVLIQAKVSGRLDEARLRTAMGMALGHHGSGQHRLQVVDCHDDAALDAARAGLQHSLVVVREAPPIRACLARHRHGDVLMLSLSHAASDGVGALAVLDAIARAYVGDYPTEGPLDLLASRDIPVRPAPTSRRVVVRSYRHGVERLRDALTRPARLAPDRLGPSDRHQEAGSDAGCGYGLHLVALSAETTGQVVDPERPHASGDVLMAALHLAIGQWNLEHYTPGRRVGVLKPVDLRPAGWRRGTIANFSVTARVSTTRPQRAGPGSALEAITTQTTRNNRSRTGVALIEGLQRSGMLALWAKQSTVVLQPLTVNRTLDAAMLCDLGCIDRPPWFGVEAGGTSELWFSPAARSPITLCIGAATLGGRLHLTFKYPRRLFGADAARRFAEGYIHQLRLVAAACGRRADVSASQLERTA